LIVERPHVGAARHAGDRARRKEVTKDGARFGLDENALRDSGNQHVAGDLAGHGKRVGRRRDAGRRLAVRGAEDVDRRSERRRGRRVGDREIDTPSRDLHDHHLATRIARVLEHEVCAVLAEH
jgi:hypothetical protein